MSTIGIHKLMDVQVGNILQSLIIYMILPKNTQRFTPKKKKKNFLPKIQTDKDLKLNLSFPKPKLLKNVFL